ncbi:hypothetical protein L6452_03116 [Arctium lappa]|uniref:Uncharacterized protein n=1 Tax=Arctium lappa TaxID=4217 RepID=A0ACB9FKZ4_ARCLA|nr:hypothetical protein L6452_03116 [Arctium lappa]
MRIGFDVGYLIYGMVQSQFRILHVGNERKPLQGNGLSPNFHFRNAFKASSLLCMAGLTSRMVSKEGFLAVSEIDFQNLVGLRVRCLSCKSLQNGLLLLKVWNLAGLKIVIRSSLPSFVVLARWTLSSEGAISPIGLEKSYFTYLWNSDLKRSLDWASVRQVEDSDLPNDHRPERSMIAIN